MTEDLRKKVMEKYENGNRNFSYENFSRADLSNLPIAGSNFNNSTLIGANLSRSVLGLGYFCDTDLSGADLSWSTLTEATMRNANLSNANLTSANLLKVNLKGANLTGANFNMAYLGSATMPDGKQYTSGLDISQYGATGVPMDL